MGLDMMLVRRALPGNNDSYTRRTNTTEGVLRGSPEIVQNLVQLINIAVMQTLDFWDDNIGVE